MVFGAANSYTGSTTVNGGTLQADIADALPETTTLTVSGTGTFDLNGYAQTVAALADGAVSSGTVTDNSVPAAFTVDGVISSSFSGLLDGAPCP